MLALLWRGPLPGPRIVCHIGVYVTQWGATNRATEVQIRSMLSGTIEAARNKKGRSASYLYRGVADDGSHWTVAFNYDPATQTARPITAF